MPEIVRIIEEMSAKGYACTIFDGQMWEVAFYKYAKTPPSEVYKSCDLLTAVEGAKKECLK